MEKYHHSIYENIIDNLPNKVDYLSQSIEKPISICNYIEETIDTLQSNGVDEIKLKKYRNLISELKPLLQELENKLNEHKDLIKSF